MLTIFVNNSLSPPYPGRGRGWVCTFPRGRGVGLQIPGEAGGGFHIVGEGECFQEQRLGLILSRRRRMLSDITSLQGATMSVRKSYALRQLAIQRCRELRRKQTPAEATLWSVLRNRRFMNLKFLRQHPIYHDLDGKETFLIADFYCHELHLIIELDGSSHENDEKSESDSGRDTACQLLGLTVLRFRNEVVFRNPRSILDAIREMVG